MHLLAATPGLVLDDDRAIDLAQSAADFAVLSMADSEITGLARAKGPRRGLRLANLASFRHPYSVDLHIERTLEPARAIVVRLLGGRSYWPYGVDRLVETARRTGAKLALLPGDEKPDAELLQLSTVTPEAHARLHAYFTHGGPENYASALAYLDELVGGPATAGPPRPVARAGRLAHAHARPGAPVAAIVFYRAHYQAGDIAPVEALVEALAAKGLDTHAFYVASLKDAAVVAFLAAEFAAAPPDIAINLTGFSVGAGDPLAALDAPVLQAVLSAESRSGWAEGTRGLAPRDIAMNVALPELDGRILSRAIGFKGPLGRDTECEVDLVGFEADRSRIGFVAELAANWVKLRRKKPADRRVALVLANYPGKDGRLANGVGLDTPASAIAILSALSAAGYTVDGAPESSAALMARLLAGPTNLRKRAAGGVRYPLADYRAFLSGRSEKVRAEIDARWGTAEADRRSDGDAFVLPAHLFGNIAVAIQPARGYEIDPSSSYHDPALVPPHGYLAFHAWLAGFDAVVHVGKHGNLEWLPGKGLALSADCFPEAALGALPNIYPFIVNDPGEGTQAKRRTSAVIVDHLTPPLTRAGAYGPQAALERLIDEYDEARRLDPRRTAPLAAEILDIARRTGLAEECAIAPGEPADRALAKLDGLLCELKEHQIRDGLHVFGTSPDAGQRRDTLAAIARVPRPGGQAENESLTRALARDLGLGFDPLDCDMSVHGDALDRIELQAARIVDGEAAPGPASAAVAGWIARALAPAFDASGAAELAGLLAGLDGRRVAPGPSGAPSRGRPDVLPTGRNFYSVDLRAVPTPSAWALGWKSAGLLLERHLQEHGDWPRAVALSAWGTANMRTGGDDIAQALALMGVRPTWEPTSLRVTGFEVMSIDLLDRPRVDVTLRVSGFFRDAFAGLIDLFDAAARKVAGLDEPAEMNPLAARVRAEGGGRDAATRVFGSKPGAYGAGLQALIDEGGWRDAGDLARAYVAWGGFAYRAGAEGEAAHGLFEKRLARVEAVLHNQDNREHDILDSDDYYQFEGGIAAAVTALSGKTPAIYHNDHSRPESPRVRTLKEEIARVVRARAANPKWIDGCRRHGYKGAFEMAATVDYLFAFAATTPCVESRQFDALFDAYLRDGDVRAFIAEVNAPALREMAQRFAEARDRGLWRPGSNDAPALLDRILERT
ncbi:MAG: cobaltochelatase subunit CobN [Alphaproteobacteria bacterium]|nr:cobaltochelatase subunit CobN [Alphaproteobacteria bacterium]